MMNPWRAAFVAAAVGVLAAVTPASAVLVMATGGEGSCTIGPPVMPADVALSATDADPPVTTDELQITKVVWSWQIVDVTYDPPGTCGISSGNGSWSVVQADPAAPDARLQGSAPDPGLYVIDLLCSVTYTLSDGSQPTGTGSAQVLVSAS